MSSSLFHQRRAERLAQLLEEAAGGLKHHTRSPHDEELAGYVRLGDGVMRTAGALSGPTTEFQTSLRAMLVATAERDGIGRTAVDDETDTNGGKRARPSRPVVGSKRARGAILVGLAAGTLALSGMSAASGDAMPGDPLYGVKRSTESARLALAGSAVSRGQLYLEFARNRLAEAESVGASGTVLAGMLDDMDNETRAGLRLLTAAALNRRDRAALDVIDGFGLGQRARLVHLGDSARVLQSLALLDRIALRSAGLRTNLTCGAAATVKSDDIGPVTPDCQGTNPGSLHTGNPPNTGKAPAHRPEVAPTGTVAPPVGTDQVAGQPSPTPTSTGLLDDLGRLVGGGH
jgi:hypothetical protein